MRPLTASELLAVWEQGTGLSAVHQALLLLGTAWPDQSLSQLAGLSIGQRDSSLLALREWTFGSTLLCFARCPACHDELEFAFETTDIHTVLEDTPPQSLACTVDGCQVQFRLPNSHDLAALLAVEDVVKMREQLLERCITHIIQDDEAIDVSVLPEHALSVIEQKMADADPQADMQLALTCPMCQHDWSVTFDIVSYFWQEITDWAQRILREVHLLASAYGWSESDILAMSAARRQLYLEMVYG